MIGIAVIACGEFACSDRCGWPMSPSCGAVVHADDDERRDDLGGQR